MYFLSAMMIGLLLQERRNVAALLDQIMGLLEGQECERK